MRKSKAQSKTTIELTPRGVFQISTTPTGDTERKKIARLDPSTRFWQAGVRWQDLRPNQVPNNAR